MKEADVDPLLFCFVSGIAAFVNMNAESLISLCINLLAFMLVDICSAIKVTR